MAAAELLAASWWAWMAPMAVQAGALALLIGLVEALLGRRLWPQLRLALWSLVLLKLFLPPSLSSPVALGAGRLDLDTVALSAPPAWLLPASALWVAGAAASLAFEIARQRRCRRELLRRTLASGPRLRALARRIGLSRLPPVFVAQHLSSPAVLGPLRPALVVPEAWLAPARREELEHALLHELAHLQRRDLWWSALWRLASCAYWFHPLVRLAAHRFAAAQELCCDAAAARGLAGDAPRYRLSLLCAALAAPQGARPALGFAAGALHARLEALERASWRHGRLRAATATGAALTLAACVLPMGESESARLRAEAWRILNAAASGDQRQNCLQLHYAATLLSRAGDNPFELEKP